MTGTDSWTPRNLLEIAATPPAAPTLIEADGGGSLLYPGLLHLISGEPETGKSWLALIPSVQLLHAGRSVLWIDTDGAGPGDTLERLRALGAADREIARFHYVDPDRAAPRERLLAICQATTPDLIVWDALTGALTIYELDSHRDQAIEVFRRTTGDIWPGATELWLDHVNKNPDNRNGYSTGSHRKAGLVKVHLQLAAPRKLSREQPGLITISAPKDRPGFHRRGPSGRVGDLHLTPDGFGRVEWSLRLGSDAVATETFRPTVYMEKVSRLLEQLGAPASKNRIERQVEGKAPHIRKAVDVLVEEGYITVEAGARNAILHRLVRPFRDFVPTSSPPRPGRAHGTSSLVPPLRGDEDEVAGDAARPRPEDEDRWQALATDGER